MFELIDPAPQVLVSEAEYARLLGFPPGYEFSERSRELAEEALAWYAQHGHPWFCAREVELSLERDTVRLGESFFTSGTLLARLAEADTIRAVVVAASAGPECEERARELWTSERPDEYFFLEILGSAIVEHLIATTGARLCAWAEPQGMAVLPHYSPGYTGWTVSDQVPLFQLLTRDRTLPLPGPLEVHASGMLRPKKSLLALFGVSRAVEKLRRFSGKLACESCAFTPCQFRRAPFTGKEPLLDDISKLQPKRPSVEPVPAPPLDLQAKYSFPTRALQKWSQERLHLAWSNTGLEARFHFDGTTCSNLGHPLAFDYFLELEGASRGYRIRSATCNPSPGDTGHTRMCSYLRDGPALLRSIAEGMPLLGKPLNEVLHWKRVPRPSGCFCDEESRQHKWAMVLEVIHYALAQLEKERADTPGERS